jgi:hypothetical protein
MQDEYRDFCTVLERELTLVEQIEEAQILVRDAVRRRAWVDFEALLDSMNRMGAEFEELDRDREAIFGRFVAALGGDAAPEGEARFYALVSRLDGEERAALTGRYRELKSRVWKIRFKNDSLAHYLGQIHTLVTGFIDAAFPDRKGKLYTRQGTPRAADMRSMVLDRQF